jgi:hypothetical protein
MAENSQPIKKTNTKNISLDWFMRGALAKIGEMLDSFTGRNWQPSSSLATSELIERLKILLDSKVRDSGARGKFAPHKIKLKMQWNKFSADSDDSGTALKRLENELLTAAVDHINDRRYHTFAPLELEIKQDYFTDGVKLSASFADVGSDDAEVNVTVPEIKVGDFAPTDPPAKPGKEIFLAAFTAGGTLKQTKLIFENNNRLSVGRTGENDLTIDDSSVSKIHASLVLNSENQLMIADTGSTNGTFINEQRISYGKAHVVGDGDRIKFGSVDVSFEHQPQAPVNGGFIASLAQDSVVIGDFEFKSRADFNAENDILSGNENGSAANHRFENENSKISGVQPAKLNLPKED